MAGLPGVGPSPQPTDARPLVFVHPRGWPAPHLVARHQQLADDTERVVGERGDGEFAVVGRSTDGKVVQVLAPPA